MSTRIGIGLLALILVLGAGGPALAKKGGGGGGGGGGDPSPPPDPALLWTDTTGRSGSMWQVLVANDDGSNIQVVVPASGDGVAADPSWAPDGNALVYRGTDAYGDMALFVVASDGTGSTVIHTGVAYDPKWSPTVAHDNDEHVLFVAEGTYYWDLWVVSPGGGAPANLTQTPGRHETYGTWSPGADRVAARYADYDASGQVTERGIVIHTVAVDAGTGQLASVGSYDIPDSTTGLGDVAWLDWARTRDELACVATSTTTTGRDVWVVPLTTPGAPRNVTRSSASEKWPTWSPDDTEIAYTQVGKGKTLGIFRRAADGTGTATEVVKGGGEHYRRPDWIR